MSLLDTLTGGETSKAEEDLQKAQEAIQNVSVPTAAQLTLPELQQYVNSGQMTPAQATAAMQGQNAYDNINLDPASMEAEMTALSQMQQVAGDNGMTPEMQAQLAGALNVANTNTQGERGSILDSLAQRGIPTSLMGAAAQHAAAGQDAQNANLSSAQAAGQAEQNALTAMANSGSLAGNINNQEYSQESQKAAAQNAINQWNAQNQTQNSQFNAGEQQQANEYNTQNQQSISNSNTGLANETTQYNAQIPETLFNNQMQKAGAEAGVSENQANQATAAGQQTAGLYSGLIGGASQMGAAGLMPTPIYAAKGGVVTRTHDGGVHVAPPYMADSGGQVPGRARVPGNSMQNDKVHALLSPGEVVVPRTMAQDPNRAKQFVAGLLKGSRPVKPMHPDDLHGMMEALSRRREQAA